MTDLDREDFAWTRSRRRVATALACCWLGYLVPVVLSVVGHPPVGPLLILAVFGLAGFVVCYLRLVAVGMLRPMQLAAPWTLLGLIVAGALVLWPLGEVWLYALPYYLVATLPCHLPFRYWVPTEGAVVLATLTLAAVYGETGGQLAEHAASVAAVGLLVSMFFWILMIMVRLRAARAELARLAVADERLRIARDLHDVLGHRLAAVALKSDLARRLLPVDPQRAAAEMSEAGQIAREALDEVRSTVAGFRESSLPGELATARALLTAAGIECTVLTPDESLPAAIADVAGWVVREGVTNVVRHARARRVWISVRSREQVSIEVADDGRGPARPTHGNGLTGLSERVIAVGGTLRVGAEDDRFRVLAQFPVSSGPVGCGAVPLAGGA